MLLVSISEFDVGPIREIVFLFRASAICRPKLSVVINKLQILIKAGNSTKLLPLPVSITGDLVNFDISLFLSISLGPPKRSIFARYFLYNLSIKSAVFLIDSALGHLSAEPLFIPIMVSVSERLYLLKKSFVILLCILFNLRNGSYLLQSSPAISPIICLWVFLLFFFNMSLSGFFPRADILCHSCVVFVGVIFPFSRKNPILFLVLKEDANSQLSLSSSRLIIILNLISFNFDLFLSIIT